MIRYVCGGQALYKCVRHAALDAIDHNAIENIAPPSLAESWDNVGLLVGDPNQDISRYLLDHRLFARLWRRKAAANNCDLVIAYHPPIFHPLKRVVAGNPVFDAIRRGVAIYSPHTALDVAEGGTNDMLADVLGLTDRKPLKSSGNQSGAV